MNTFLRTTLFSLLVWTGVQPAIASPTQPQLRPDSFMRNWVMPGIKYGGAVGATLSGLFWLYCKHELDVARKHLAYLNSIPETTIKALDFGARSMMAYERLAAEQTIQNMLRSAKYARSWGFALAGTSAAGFLGSWADKKYGWFGDSQERRKILVKKGFRDFLTGVQQDINRHGSSFHNERLFSQWQYPHRLPEVELYKGQPGNGDCATYSLNYHLTPEKRTEIGLPASGVEAQVEALRTKIINQVVARAKDEIGMNRSNARRLIDADLDAKVAEQERMAMSPMRAIAKKLGQELGSDAAYPAARQTIGQLLDAATDEQVVAIGEKLVQRPIVNEMTKQIYGSSTAAARWENELRTRIAYDKKVADSAEAEMPLAPPTEQEKEMVTFKEIDNLGKIVQKYKSQMMAPRRGGIRPGNAWFEAGEIRVAAEDVLKHPIFVWSTQGGPLTLIEVHGSQFVDRNFDMRNAIHLWHTGGHYQNIEIPRFLSSQ